MVSMREYTLESGGPGNPREKLILLPGIEWR
jgi:hypothetical protein